MKPLPLSLVFTLGCIASLSGQTVIPSMYATTEASSSTAYPFGLSSPCRLQYLYDRAYVDKPVVPMGQLAIRGNGGTATAGKLQVELEIGLTTTTVSPWAASTTFTSNHGLDFKVVFNRKKIDLPAQPATPTPAPFVAVFVLDTPYVYVRANGNLLIDYIVHGQPAGTYSHDTSFTLTPTHTAVGTPCGNETQTVSGGSVTTPTSTLTYTLAGGPPNGTWIHLLGASQLPSPVPLPLGGCNLYQDIILLLTGATNATGGGQVVYPLPVTARGAVVYGQFLALDAAATRLGATQSHRSLIGGLDSHTRIYSLTSATVPTGTIQLGVGIVTELK
jgi:hypothetical protein